MSITKQPCAGCGEPIEADQAGAVCDICAAIDSLHSTMVRLGRVRDRRQDLWPHRNANQIGDRELPLGDRE